MMITVRMSVWEKILGWIMIAAHLLFLGLLVEILFVTMGWDTTSAAGQTELNIAYFIIGWLLTGAVFFHFLIRNFKTFLRSIKKSFLGVLAGGAALMVLNMAVNLLITNLLPDFSNANDANLEQMGQVSGLHHTLMLICTAFLVPVTEECLYRGVLFQTVYHRNRILAYVLSTVIFSAIHWVGYIGQINDPLYFIVAFHQYLPAGIAFSLAYEMSDSIWAPIILHSINNFIAMTM